MRTKKIKIGIVWANPYNKNMGVAALAYSSLLLIKDVLNEMNLNDYTISFIGSSKNQKDSIQIIEEKIEFNNFYGFNFLSWRTFIKLIIYPSKYKTFQLFKFDYLFDIAEGDSFTDIYGNSRFNKILSSKILYSFINKKQILLPQTIGPFKNEKSERRAFSVMRKLKYVISRDNQSFIYASKFLTKEKIFETIDMAFYLPFKKKQFKSDKINVGVNISGLLWNGGYTNNNQFNLKTNYQKLILDIIEYFSNIENILIHLIPHVIPENQLVEDDYAVSEKIAMKFQNLILAPRFKNPVEAKSYISGLDFFTGARMHACIAAYSSNVPMCPMAYSRKFNGLFKETLKYKPMADLVNHNNKFAYEHIIQAFDNRNELLEEIKLNNKNIVKSRLELLKKILKQSLTE